MKRTVALALLLVLPAGAWTPTWAEDRPADIRAQLSPRRQTVLAAELGAKVDRLSVREGDRFKSGQMLVQLDCQIQRAQMEEARAALAAAEKLASVNAQLRDLNAAGQIEVENARAEALKARAKANAGQAVLSKCAINAPFPGRVVEVKVNEQQFVQPGQPILDILDDSVLEVDFLAPSRWLAWLKPGRPLELAVDETGKTYPARVARLGARVDPLSQSIKVTAEIVGGFPELLAGMSGRVLIAPPSNP
ncbi:MAG: efflux RND transporter periplasmic adaptor subunit [Magnetospirillum sp.]|nr:efflux RND transporter periplasmic adaptor subunit [Magnetospirillum sp.]